MTKPPPQFATLVQINYYGTGRCFTAPSLPINKLITGGKSLTTERYNTPKYIVRSLSMTNFLAQHGHKILKVEDSEKNPKLKVFFFEDTAALHNTMAKFHKGV